MEDEIEAIRERHEAEIREPNKWTFNRAETAHADRATLLRALDAMAEENARLREALKRAEEIAALIDHVEFYTAESAMGDLQTIRFIARAALKETGQ